MWTLVLPVGGGNVQNDICLLIPALSKIIKGAVNYDFDVAEQTVSLDFMVVCELCGECSSICVKDKTGCTFVFISPALFNSFVP